MRSLLKRLTKLEKIKAPADKLWIIRMIIANGQCSLPEEEKKKCMDRQEAEAKEKEKANKENRSTIVFMTCENCEHFDKPDYYL